MKYLLFDSIGGAAGDMILAALIDLGVDAGQLNRDLDSLGIGAFEIVPRPFSDAGLHGLRLEIKLPPASGAIQAESALPRSPIRRHDHGHVHDHGHKHGHNHRHDHDHIHGLDHGHARGGRGLTEIRQLITDSRLPAPVKQASCAVFKRLAEAEGRVHHCDPETIHFHEVGALDSILDIVGCCLARHYLGVDGVQVSPLPLGQGTLQCDHGRLPIPAPATVELLRSFEVIRTDEPFELVTPTGAAILTDWHTLVDAPLEGRLAGTGHGFGSRTLRQRPNLLRAMLMETAPPPPIPGRDSCVELQCNLDDMTPEWIGPLLPQLLEAGALDAFTTAVQMKKMRPACLLTVLCRPADRAKLIDLLFKATTTFGIRWRNLEREVLIRRHREVSTPYGKVGVKIGSRAGQDLVRSPEFEDCRQRAIEHRVSVRDVYAAALAALP